MRVLPILLGAFLGALLGGGGNVLIGAIAGAAFAYLLLANSALRADLEKFERRLDGFGAFLRKDADKRRESEHEQPVQPVVRPTPEPEPTEPVLSQPAAAKIKTPVPSRSIPAQEYTPAAPEPTAFDKGIELAKEWLTTGNVPVKIGVIVSFFGVSFLLKYAIDTEILVFPIWLRYLVVATVGTGLAFLGWRLRETRKTYGLSLQGGGIGIVYLTIFAAYRLHPMLSAPVAFGLMVLVTIAIGALAVLQEARVLAILGVVGGFLAPLLASTGTGNHVVLFTYYLILNCAILGIAWQRAWRSLNIIGFAFTFLVGSLWGIEYYRPELFASTEPFLVAHFLFYTVIAILFAFRQPPDLRGVVDGTLVFGTPVIAFALQAMLLEDNQDGLAISAAVVAAFYALNALWLHRTQGEEMRLLVQSFLALAVAFATIAIPLALDDRGTSVAWALEGAALVWIGVRQNTRLAKFTGTALVFASGVMFIDHGWRNDLGMPVLNGNVLGGILISAASLFSSRLLATDERQFPIQKLASVVLLLWGVGWWLGTGSLETLDRLSSGNEVYVLTVFSALSFAALAWRANRVGWQPATWLTLAYIPLLPVLALGYLLEFDHLFTGPGILTWAIAFAAHLVILRMFGDKPVAASWHAAGVLLFAAFLGYEVFWRLDQSALNDVWSHSGVMLVWLVIAAAIIRMRDLVDWPVRRNRTAYLAAASFLIAVQLVMLLLLVIDTNGDPINIPYVPILNPYDALTIAGLAAALYSLRVLRADTKWLVKGIYELLFNLWAIATWLLSTIGVVRAVAIYEDIYWSGNALAAADSVQAALSVYWAVLGLAGMVLGARNSERRVWMAGAALMALVVIKLFLVDLGNTGTVERIVSFLGVGVTLLVVGYFAPAPPRQADEPET